jgi:hypothetical protein
MVAPIGPGVVRAVPHYDCGWDLGRVVASIVRAHKAIAATAE